MAATPNGDPRRPSGSGDVKRVAAQLSVITSVLAILAWFGIDNWSELKDWFNHRSVSGKPPVEQSVPVVPPVQQPRSPAPPARQADPACAEALQVMESVSASLQGSTGATHAMAFELRGFADNFDRAAASARSLQVRLAIKEIGTDLRTMAYDLDAGDVDAAWGVLNKMSRDGSLAKACPD